MSETGRPLFNSPRLFFNMTTGMMRSGQGFEERRCLPGYNQRAVGADDERDTRCRRESERQHSSNPVRTRLGPPRRLTKRASRTRERVHGHCCFVSPLSLSLVNSDAARAAGASSSRRTKYSLRPLLLALQAAQPSLERAIKNEQTFTGQFSLEGLWVTTAVFRFPLCPACLSTPACP